MRNAERPTSTLVKAHPSGLSSFLVDDIITSSLQCSLDSRHHGGTIGTGQHLQLRYSLELDCDRKWLPAAHDEFFNVGLLDQPPAPAPP